MLTHTTPRAKALLVALALSALLLTSCGGGGYDYQIDMTEYNAAINAEGDVYLTLVNKENPVAETFVPANLTALDPALTLYGKTVELEANVALAAEALVLELHALGYEDIVVTSGYRSYSYQQSLHNNYINKEQEAHPDWTRARCEAQVLTYSALPGQSEHQTGLCLDLISTENVVLDETFADHPAYAWLTENAHRFGFILRFPEGEEKHTGYSYEPWHYRFVGVETATKLYNRGLTLEEYLD